MKLIYAEPIVRDLTGMKSMFDAISLDGMIKGLNEAPSVDAVPVVHGRWECTYDEATGETDVTCSRCKSTRTINGCYVTTKGESCYFEDNYCPNCGAKMDGDGNGDSQGWLEWRQRQHLYRNETHRKRR